MDKRRSNNVKGEIFLNMLFHIKKTLAEFQVKYKHLLINLHFLIIWFFLIIALHNMEISSKKLTTNGSPAYSNEVVSPYKSIQNHPSNITSLQTHATLPLSDIINGINL